MAAQVVSDAHCKLRQEQRRISSVDLETAKRHGTKSVSITPNGPNKGVERFKYEYKGVTFITDKLDGRKITCWAEGLSFHALPIQKERMKDLEDVRKFLRLHPVNITTHTIFVVDQSGSMKLSDVPGARSRHVAVFSAILIDYLLESMMKPEANGGHDVITIMDMRDSTDVVLDREPVDELTYNKVVQLMQTRLPGGQGNYIPAFQRLHQVLCPPPRRWRYSIRSSKSAPPSQSIPQTSVVFLTDGRPSDKKCRDADGELWRLPQAEWVLSKVKQNVLQIASHLGSKSSFTFISFGAGSSRTRNHDFLVELSNAANNGGCKEAQAVDSETSTERLGSILTTVSATTTAHCTSLTTGQALERKRLLSIDQKVPLVKQVELLNARRGPSLLDFDVLSSSNHFLQRVELKKVKGERHRQAVATSFLSARADGLAIFKRPFADGGERFAFLAREVIGSSFPSTCRFVGDWLVAKQTRRHLNNPRSFHVMYLKLQQAAGRLARKFNQRLEILNRGMRLGLPSLEFIDCSVYTWKCQETEAPRRGNEFEEVNWLAEAECLIEPLLDPRVDFTKFNSNFGWVGEGARKDDKNDGEVQRAMQMKHVSFGPVLDAISDDEEEEEEVVEGSKVPGLTGFKFFFYVCAY